MFEPSLSILSRFLFRQGNPLVFIIIYDIKIMHGHNIFAVYAILGDVRTVLHQAYTFYITCVSP